MLSAGCSGVISEESRQIGEVREEIAVARKDPDVRLQGASFLVDAEDTLAQASRAAGDPAQVRHLAYLAKRKVEIARSMTRLKLTAIQLTALTNKPSNKAVRQSQARKGHMNGKAERGVATGDGAASKPNIAGRPKQEAGSRPSDVPGIGSVHGNIGSDLGKVESRKVIKTAQLFADANLIQLSTGAHRELAPLVEFLRAHPKSVVVVESYTKGQGRTEKELEWAVYAAEAVKYYLVDHGVESSQIYTVGSIMRFAALGHSVERGALEDRIEINLFAQPANSILVPTSGDNQTRSAAPNR
jgi:outer membrane protein OmpA-like peptidoglycan-associated protein